MLGATRNPHSCTQQTSCSELKVHARSPSPPRSNESNALTVAQDHAQQVLMHEHALSSDAEVPAVKRMRTAAPSSSPSTVDVDAVHRPSPKLSSSEVLSEDTLGDLTSTCSSDGAPGVHGALARSHTTATTCTPARAASSSTSPSSASPPRPPPPPPPPHAPHQTRAKGPYAPFRMPTPTGTALPAPTLGLDSTRSTRRARSKLMPVGSTAALGSSSSGNLRGCGMRRSGRNPARTKINELQARVRTLRLAARYKKFVIASA